MTFATPFENRTYHNVEHLHTVYLKVTAAADVDASGYAVTWGSPHVSAVTKTAEGKMKIALTRTWKELVGVNYITTRSDSKCLLENDTSTSTSDPHVDLIWEEAGANTDPDSAVMHIQLHLRLGQMAMI